MIKILFSMILLCSTAHASVGHYHENLTLSSYNSPPTFTIDLSFDYDSVSNQILNVNGSFTQLSDSYTGKFDTALWASPNFGLSNPHSNAEITYNTPNLSPSEIGTNYLSVAFTAQSGIITSGDFLSPRLTSPTLFQSFLSLPNGDLFAVVQELPLYSEYARSVIFTQPSLGCIYYCDGGSSNYIPAFLSDRNKPIYLPRTELSPVPVPSAIWIFSTGFIVGGFKTEVQHPKCQ